MTKSLIDYSYITEAYAGSRIFASFQGLPFAERGLVIVEPGAELWAMYFFRCRGRLHIFDDWDKRTSCGRFGKSHDIHLIKRIVDSLDISDVSSFEKQMKVGYYKGAPFGGSFAERATGGNASMLLGTLVEKWAQLQQRSFRKPLPSLKAIALERVERIFSEHLGVDFRDLLDAGGAFDKVVWKVVCDEPTSIIPLRPIAAISAASSSRSVVTHGLARS